MEVDIKQILEDAGYKVLNEKETDDLVKKAIESNKNCEDMGPWTGGTHWDKEK